jgi:hypothetical protein
MLPSAFISCIESMYSVERCQNMTDFMNKKVLVYFVNLILYVVYFVCVLGMFDGVHGKVTTNSGYTLQFRIN